MTPIVDASDDRIWKQVLTFANANHGAIMEAEHEYNASAAGLILRVMDGRTGEISGLGVWWDTGNKDGMLSDLETLERLISDLKARIETTE